MRGYMRVIEKTMSPTRYQMSPTRDQRMPRCEVRSNESYARSNESYARSSAMSRCEVTWRRLREAMQSHAREEMLGEYVNNLK